MAVKDVSLAAHAGEILGIGGIGGNGQTELVEVITGLRAPTQGTVEIASCSLGDCDPKTARDSGVCYVPADRHGVGTIASMSVAENMILVRHGDSPLSRRGFLRHARIRSYTEELVGQYSIQCQGTGAETRTLSGGNLQRLVLARELSGEPQLIVAEYPTRGLDIAATEYVHQILREQRGRGAAVVAVFSDLDELLQLSDRVAIMFEGRIQGIMERDEFDIESIGLMMAGVDPDKEKAVQ